jgi:SMC interacting uncharacterized protein involved in chromosome segregation
MKKVETVYDYLLKNKIISLDEIVKVINGKTFRTTQSKVSASGHNYPKKFKVGDNLTGRIAGEASLSIRSGLNNAAVNSEGVFTSRNTIYFHELVFDSISKENIQAQLDTLIKDFNTEKEDLESKLQLMDALGISEISDQIVEIATILKDYDIKPEDKMKIASTICEKLV